MSDKVYRDHKGQQFKTTATKRSKISNRKPPNRHSMDSVSDEFLSASAKKLKPGVTDEDRDIDEGLWYRLINFMAVFTTLSQMIVCKKCKGDVSFTETSKRGLGFRIVMTQ